MTFQIKRLYGLPNHPGDIIETGFATEELAREALNEKYKYHGPMGKKNYWHEIEEELDVEKE